MRASQEGHVEISKLLITAGADVNRKNYEGMNALMLASQRGHSAMVMLLIKAPCAMDEQTQQGSTALMLACKRGHEECVKVLVSMGAEIFIRDNRNRTARDTATRRNHTNLLPWLDTQAQIKLHQEYQQSERVQCLLEIKQAYEQGNLRIDFEDRNALHLLSAFQRRDSNEQQQKQQQPIDKESSSNMMVDDVYNSISSSSNYSNTPPNNLLALPVIPGSLTSNLVRNNSGPVRSGNIVTWQHNASSTFHKDQDFFDHFINQFAPLVNSNMSQIHSPNNNNTSITPSFSMKQQSSSSEPITAPTATATTANINTISNNGFNLASAMQIYNSIMPPAPPSSINTTTTAAAAAINNNHRPESITTTTNTNSASSKLAALTIAATANWEITPADVEKNPDMRHHIFVTNIIKSTPSNRSQPYEWSALLIKALTLPPGIYDLICEFMPLPRVWNWTLEVLKKRCTLIPQACAVDLSIMLDEMLTDADIFKGSQQKLLVMKLNSNPQIFNYLVSEWKMPPILINHLRVWADVQSILNRAVLEYEFSLKLPMIRSMYGVCMDLLRWSQNRCSPYRVLVETVGYSSLANDLLLKLNPAAKGRKMYLGHPEDPNSLLAYGHVYGSSGMGGDEDMSMVGTETVMDQDTETELHNDLDADDTQVGFSCSFYYRFYYFEYNLLT